MNKHALPTLFHVTGLLLLSLIITSSTFAADAPSEDAINAMGQKWQKITSSGFADTEEANMVMSTFPQDKTAVEGSSNGEAKTSLGQFEAYLGSTKTQLEQQPGTELQSKTMMAKRWDMVSQQALQSGSNVPQNMIDMYKQMAGIETLKKNGGIYAAITGPTDAKAVEFNEQIAYIEQVGVMMGAIDNAVTPRDAYSGGDKADLHAKIEQKWKSFYPADTIMGIRFIDETWTTRNEERFNNVTGWYDLNISSLEVKVVVKEDESIANIYPVFLMKDHLNNDALEIDVESAKSIPGMGSKMLVKNYTP